MIPHSSVYDIAIIGAGAIGTALARALSRFQLSILLIDAAPDVASGATRANSGIIHGGYSAKAGSRKAEFCRRGNRMFPQLAAELDFPYAEIGSVVLAFSERDMETLRTLQKNGEANGVPRLELHGAPETYRRVPRLAPGVLGGLFCDESGIVSPYEYAIALAENAVANGVSLVLDSAVEKLEAAPDGIRLFAGGRDYRAHRVVNAAGVGAEGIASLVGASPFSIKPRKGQYLLLRRGASEGLGTVVFQPPTEKGKGVLVTPTTWGNLLIGPDAQEVQDPGDLGTDPESLARMVLQARLSVADFDIKQAIRAFSGVRPACDRGDFILEWSRELEGLLHIAGIESPGLTSSPALAMHAVSMLEESGLKLTKRPDFQSRRRAIIKPGPLKPPAEAAKAASLPPGAPGRIVCRCEQVTEDMIVSTLKRGIPIRELDAVKRRTRAGMGACQGTFCGPRVRDLLIERGDFSESEILPLNRNRQETMAQISAMKSVLEMNGEQ